MHAFICREPAIMYMNDQGLTNLYGSVMFLEYRRVGSTKLIVLLNVFHI